MQVSGIETFPFYCFSGKMYILVNETVFTCRLKNYSIGSFGKALSFCKTKICSTQTTAYL